MADDTKENFDKRKKRVKKIKKLIIATCVVLFVLPLLLSIILLCRVKSLEHRIDTIISENDLAAGEQESSVDVVNAKRRENAVSPDAVEPDETPEPKKVYLTFDDGPSKETEKVLDILKEKQVKASFFTIGRDDEFSKKIYKRIVEEGHTLGMHSYSHIYKEIYGSMEGFQKDFQKISNLLFDITGVRSTFYRFPGGSSNSVNQFPVEQYAAYLESQGVVYMDWNVIAANGTTDDVTVDDMVQSLMDGVSNYDTSVVLLYDSVDKKMTAKSLGAMIDRLLAEGYQILPLDANTVPVHHS